MTSGKIVTTISCRPNITFMSFIFDCRWNFSVGEHEISLVKSQLNPGSQHRITTAPVPDNSMPVMDDDDAYVTDCSDEHTGTYFDVLLLKTQISFRRKKFLHNKL